MAEKETKTILVVEDDKFLLKALTEKLSGQGYKVEVAADGLAASKLIKEIVPDIILLDLIMPGRNGFDILSEIQEIDALNDVPVIVLSNLGQKTDIEKAKALGAKDFFIKANTPIQEIVEKVKKYTT